MQLERVELDHLLGVVVEDVEGVDRRAANVDVAAGRQVLAVIPKGEGFVRKALCVRTSLKGA